LRPRAGNFKLRPFKRLNLHGFWFTIVFVLVFARNADGSFSAARIALAQSLAAVCEPFFYAWGEIGFFLLRLVSTHRF
jgi:hypothetical protein